VIYTGLSGFSKGNGLGLEMVSGRFWLFGVEKVEKAQKGAVVKMLIQTRHGDGYQESGPGGKRGRRVESHEVGGS
jgi:hypothetical protein